MIKTTLKELITISPIMQEIGQMKLIGKAGYWSAKLLKKVMQELDAYEVERKKLVEEHKNFTDEGGFSEVKKNTPKWKDYLDAVEKLQEIEIEINAEPLNIEYFEGQEISVLQYALLMPNFMRDESFPEPLQGEVLPPHAEVFSPQVADA